MGIETLEAAAAGQCIKVSGDSDAALPHEQLQQIALDHYANTNNLARNYSARFFPKPAAPKKKKAAAAPAPVPPARPSQPPQ
jgi:hypothetical protein